MDDVVNKTSTTFTFRIPFFFVPNLVWIDLGQLFIFYSNPPQIKIKQVTSWPLVERAIHYMTSALAHTDIGVIFICVLKTLVQLVIHALLLYLFISNPSHVS